MTIRQQWDEFLTDWGTLDTELEDGTLPTQWIEVAITPAQYQDWSAAGGFDPERVKELLDAGFNPKSLSRRVTEEDFEEERIQPSIHYTGYSIAYMFCNGDISLEEVRNLID